MRRRTAAPVPGAAARRRADHGAVWNGTRPPDSFLTGANRRHVAGKPADRREVPGRAVFARTGGGAKRRPAFVQLPNRNVRPGDPIQPARRNRPGSRFLSFLIVRRPPSPVFSSAASIPSIRAALRFSRRAQGRYTPGWYPLNSGGGSIRPKSAAAVILVARRSVTTTGVFIFSAAAAVLSIGSPLRFFLPSAAPQLRPSHPGGGLLDPGRRDSSAATVRLRHLGHGGRRPARPRPGFSVNGRRAAPPFPSRRRSPRSSPPRSPRHRRPGRRPRRQSAAVFHRRFFMGSHPAPARRAVSIHPTTAAVVQRDPARVFRPSPPRSSSPFIPATVVLPGSPLRSSGASSRWRPPRSRPPPGSPWRCRPGPRWRNSAASSSISDPGRIAARRPPPSHRRGSRSRRPRFQAGPVFRRRSAAAVIGASVFSDKRRASPSLRLSLCLSLRLSLLPLFGNCIDQFPATLA